MSHGDSYKIMNEELDLVENTIEISYEDECFDTDVDVIETEDCIEYKAPIGPNIVVTKTPTRDGRFDHRGGVLTSAISVAPRKPTKLVERGSTRGRTQILSKRRGTPQSALRDTFRRLQLGYSGKSTTNCRTNGGMSVQIRKCSAALQQLNQKSSTSSLLAYPNFYPDGVVQKRVNSAKKLQIKDLMSKVRQLENIIEDARIENRTLKNVHYRQDMALRKYEGADADLPKMLQHHRNEVHCLQTNLRKVHARTRGYEDTMRALNQKVQKLDQENKKLISLVTEGNLEERHDLQERLNAMTFHAQRSEEKLADLSRHIEILEKNHYHQVAVEHAKLRSSNKMLFDTNQKIDQMNESIRQKDRIINYLRIRTCRDPDLEPPILKKMLADQNKTMEGKPCRRSSFDSASRSVTPERRGPGVTRKHRHFVETKTHPRHHKFQESKPAKQEESDFEEEDLNSLSRSGETSGRSFAKDSGSGTLEDEYRNQISQNQDTSSEEEEDESNEAGDKIKELDPNNLEEYYHFDPVNEEDLSVYTPSKSLYLEALDSSCNVSSINNSPEASVIMTGDGDARPPSEMNMTPPISSESIQQFVNPVDQCKHENIIGAAGDAGSGNISDDSPKGGHGISNRSHFSSKTGIANFGSKTGIANFGSKTEMAIQTSNNTKNTGSRSECQLIPPPASAASKVEILNNLGKDKEDQGIPCRSRFTSKVEIMNNNSSDREGQGERMPSRSNFVIRTEIGKNKSEIQSPMSSTRAVIRDTVNNEKNQPDIFGNPSRANFVETVNNNAKQSEGNSNRSNLRNARTEFATNNAAEGPGISSPINSGSKTGVAEKAAEGQTRTAFASKTESGFVSQRSDIVPSAEKVRLAQLKARYSYSGRLSGREIVSDSSDSHDESGEDSEAGTDGDMDDKLPIEKMKMHFKVPKSNVRNMNETNSFKSVARLNNIFRDLKENHEKSREPSPRIFSTDTPFEIPKIYSPKLTTPTQLPSPLSGKLSESRCLFPKVGTPYPHPSKELLFPERKFPEIPPLKGLGSIVPDGPKKPSIPAFDSPIFSANSTLKNVVVKKPKSFFDQMPSPPAAGAQHFDFELASIFQKRPSDQKLTSPKVEETELTKRAYHDSLTTTFQKKNLQQQQVPRKVTPVKGNNVTASPGTSTVNVHNQATRKTSGIWK